MTNPQDGTAYYWTAKDLVAEGLCTPQCLLATEDDGLQWITCQCRCNGVLHGQLSRSMIERYSLVEHFVIAAADRGRPDPMARYLDAGGDPRLMTEAERRLYDAESLLEVTKKQNEAGAPGSGDADWLAFVERLVVDARSRVEQEASL